MSWAREVAVAALPVGLSWLGEPSPEARIALPPATTAGIWLTSTKFLPLMHEIALLATRSPLTSTRVGRLRNCSCEPPAVFWLLLFALLVPALLRPAKAGTDLRRISSGLVDTPLCSNC